MKIKWNSEKWEVKYYPGNPGRWSLERPFVTVSWFLYFPQVNYFIEFLREEEQAMTLEIICYYCKKKPDQIEEYVYLAKDEGVTPDEFVKTGEGTYNKDNGHFCCTDCYIEIGMPATPPGSEHGWVAP